MKILVFNFILLLGFTNYGDILTGLSKNYVLLHDKMEKQYYHEYIQSSEISYKNDLEQYNKALLDFYASDIGIVDYLFTYENKIKLNCNWLSTVNPLSAKIDRYDYLKESEGALVLIDNYLTKGKKDISIPTYFDILTYKKMKEFYKKNKTNDINELRVRYSEFIKTLKQKKPH